LYLLMCVGGAFGQWGSWRTLNGCPLNAGEVAGGVIGNYLYLFGQTSSSTESKKTARLDLTTGAWNFVKDRPKAGNHQCALVIDGKLYAFGGFKSDFDVQIYDPVANTWSLGKPIPFRTGSANCAYIQGKVYLAGGIDSNTGTIVNAAAYTPGANGGSWTSIASMPKGSNHAAYATDGNKFWIFGGRSGFNKPSAGFGTVQVYDPATNTWTSSDNGSGVQPLQYYRGGMGTAVFYGGEFFVIGGETNSSSQPDVKPNKVYDRVDIYNPTSNTWRVGTPMPTPRHGIYPLLTGNEIYVIDGGIKSGNSQSTIVEVFTMGAPALPSNFGK